MNVFISWSGTRSRAVAEVLKDWIKSVIQAINPWISTQDIDRGATWFGAIQDQLQATSVGIICLTQENKEMPWILFEAGALAKGLPSNRVCTFLIDLQPEHVKAPLGQFNATLATREGVRELVETLNKALPSPLDDKTLATAFNRGWPEFEKSFNEALTNTQAGAAKVAPPDINQVLAEILATTRSVEQRVGRVERLVGVLGQSGSPASTWVPVSEEALDAARNLAWQHHLFDKYGVGKSKYASVLAALGIDSGPDSPDVVVPPPPSTEGMAQHDGPVSARLAVIKAAERIKAANATQKTPPAEDVK